MSFLNEEFRTFMFEVKNNKSPGAYANGLINIENLLTVDIDVEYDKDECENLYSKLQYYRKKPDLVGKDEHTLRQYASI